VEVSGDLNVRRVRLREGERAGEKSRRARERILGRGKMERARKVERVITWIRRTTRFGKLAEIGVHRIRA
jgi:hypothetical protein